VSIHAESIPEFLLKENIKDSNGNSPSDFNYDKTTLLITEEQMAAQKPFMRAYWRVKKHHFDKIVLVKLGRFYEAFFEDGNICR